MDSGMGSFASAFLRAVKTGPNNQVSALSKACGQTRSAQYVLE
jgi:hypothetical protein